MFHLLKHQWTCNSVAVHVCVMKECVEDGEEGISQQQRPLHGCPSQRTEHSGILRLEKRLKKDQSHHFLSREFGFFFFHPLAVLRNLYIKIYN